MNYYFLTSIYRNQFTLSSGFTLREALVTFSADDAAEIWLNGTELDDFNASLTSPDATRPYHICNSLAIPVSLFRPGRNVLAFRVPNLMTYEGLNYSLSLIGSTDKGNH